MKFNRAQFEEIVEFAQATLDTNNDATFDLVLTPDALYINGFDCNDEELTTDE